MYEIFFHRKELIYTRPSLRISNLWIYLHDGVGNVKNVGFSVKTVKNINFICPLRVSLNSNHWNNARILFLGPKIIKKSCGQGILVKNLIPGEVVIMCKIPPKALNFSWKKHKINFLKTHNSAPYVLILTYDTVLERKELIDYHHYLKMDIT